MSEKRSDKRLNIGIKLTITSLSKENTNSLTDLNITVDVTDISSSGIGFNSECVFPIGYYFIADIELASDLPQIITDVRIIRSEALSMDEYHYGCEFVAISPSVSKMLDDFSSRL